MLMNARPNGPLKTRDRTAEAVRFASRMLLERSAVVPEMDLVEHALRFAPGEVDLSRFRSYYEANSLQHRELGGRTYVTSAEAVAEEKKLLHLAETGKGRWRGVRDLAPQLNREGTTLAEKILASGDGVVVLEGAAGTGKTTVALELDAALRRCGGQLVALAPTAKASRGTLREDGLKGAETVARFLSQEELQGSVKGGVVWVDEAGLVPTRDVVQLLDIASKAGARVVLVGDRGQHRSVRRGGCLYVLARYADIKPFELKEIRRQRGELKEAVSALAKGDALRGLNILEKTGSVHRDTAENCREQAAARYADALSEGVNVGLVTATNDERKLVNAAVRDELQKRGLIGRSHRVESLEPLGWTVAEKQRSDFYWKGHFVVFHRACRSWPAGTRFEPGKVWSVVGHDPFGNVLVRNGLALGALPMKYAKHFDVFTREEIGLAKGDMVQVTRNTRVESPAQRVWNSIPANRRKRYGELTNGSVHRIAAVKRDGSVRLESGYSLPAGFGFLRHGYCTTTYSAQSATYDLAIVTLTGNVLAKDNDRMFYVALSRGREVSVHVRTDLNLARALSRRDGVMVATDVVEERDPAVEAQREQARAAAMEAERTERDRQRERAERENGRYRDR